MLSTKDAKKVIDALEQAVLTLGLIVVKTDNDNIKDLINRCLSSINKTLDKGE